MTKPLIVFLIVLLTGCTVLPTKEPTSTAIYDLGPAPIIAPQSILSSSPANFQFAVIAAPTWLNTQAIHYRLAYHNPTRVYTYAISRWNAPPAELLTERFRQYFSSKAIQSLKNEVVANHLLKINLAEFTQTFNSPNNSHVVIQLHAALYESLSHSPITQRSFIEKQETQTADAAGAVAAFAIASDKILNALLQWLANMDQ